MFFSTNFEFQINYIIIVIWTLFFIACSYYLEYYDSNGLLNLLLLHLLIFTNTGTLIACCINEKGAYAYLGIYRFQMNIRKHLFHILPLSPGSILIAYAIVIRNIHLLSHYITKITNLGYLMLLGIVNLYWYFDIDVSLIIFFSTSSEFQINYIK